MTADREWGEAVRTAYSLRGCDEGGSWQKEGGEGGATTTNPNPNPNRGRGLSLARLECGQRQSRCSGALPLAAPAPLRIELRLLDFQNRRGAVPKHRLPGLYRVYEGVTKRACLVLEVMMGGGEE